jgi:hypothetical protein
LKAPQVLETIRRAKNLDLPQVQRVFRPLMALLYVAPAAWLAVTTFIVAACRAASFGDARIEHERS